MSPLHSGTEKKVGAINYADFWKFYLFLKNLKKKIRRSVIKPYDLISQ